MVIIRAKCEECGQEWSITEENFDTIVQGPEPHASQCSDDARVVLWTPEKMN